MPISAINHYNVMVSDLERSVEFYAEVLGLDPGDRPPFSTHGAWLYLGEQPILHLSTSRKATSQKSDAFDHIAFTASDVAAFRAKLAQRGVKFDEFAVPDRELHQLFFRDPDGVEIELQFAGEDARAARAAGAKVDSSRGRNT
ncbi:MAG: VOC family protein [Burkholderiales bacterium]|nr:VOC family protein [Burkholderiales bacterium]